MFFETSGQCWAFLTMVYAGLLLGAWYDALRFVRRITHAKKWGTVLLDILFWLVAAVWVSVALAYSAPGGLRGYALVGLAVGGLIYWWGLGQVVHFMLRWLMKITRRLTRSPFGRKIYGFFLYIYQIGRRKTPDSE